MTIRLDGAGILAVLNSGEVADVIAELAETVAAEVDGIDTHDGPADVDWAEFTTDRRAAAVTILHPAGLGLEAKRAPLAKAARAAGLQVKSRKAAQ